MKNKRKARKIGTIAILALLASGAIHATKLRNDSGRFLQVDCETQTLNVRANDNIEIPGNCNTITIRVNGKSISVSGSQIIITPNEDLVKKN